MKISINQNVGIIGRSQSRGYYQMLVVIITEMFAGTNITLDDKGTSGVILCSVVGRSSTIFCMPIHKLYKICPAG